ncbi:MerR family transcriptional regulator [Pseudomonas sp. nanlin1]|uniref:MerR family transcriptional regulator n=1 Tax=Pseudomonas sp. nanlin1 TaxID=3040605 RepID=UPI003890799B
MQSDPTVEPAGGHWLPIREVARQTGVNPVTLRAWERRYGLIVPHRTAKGHRLYDAEHVRRVQLVVTWLSRGVSVSQVKALLDAPQSLKGEPIESEWLPLREQLIEAIAALAERRVDDLFNQAMAIYPPVTLCEQLLLPLLEALEQRWQSQFGAQMERVFFFTWLRSKFGARLYHNNRQLSGAPVLLINQSDLPLEPHLWLTAWLVSSANCPVTVLDWPLPPSELALASERLKARAVLFYSRKVVGPGVLARLASSCSSPAWLVGPAVVLHRNEAGPAGDDMAGLSLAPTPLAALQALQQAGLL